MLYRVLPAESGLYLCFRLEIVSIEVAVVLALFYGFRRSELLGLKWSDVDFDSNTITIKEVVVKGGNNIHYKE